jgi:molybdopterin synthase catalytic subunit
MRVDVRLFAVLKERAKTDRITVEVGGSSASVEELLSAIARAAPGLSQLLPIVRVAINQELATPEKRIAAGDEVALIPPVSGGSGLGLFALRASAIREEEVIDAVRAREAGAIVSFAGTVRSKTGEHAVIALEYEAYEGMAERVLRSIGEQILTRWPGARAAILHRTGRLTVGEVSVVIAVSSPHRADAFEGCRFAIERLKADVPIWKKEIREDGSVWVGVGS